MNGLRKIEVHCAEEAVYHPTAVPSSPPLDPSLATLHDPWGISAKKSEKNIRNKNNWKRKTKLDQKSNQKSAKSGLTISLNDTHSMDPSI